MSWIRDHFYRFVFPALQATVERGRVPAAFVIGKQFDVRPVPGKGPSELRKLMALCQELNVTPMGRMIPYRRPEGSIDSTFFAINGANGVEKGDYTDPQSWVRFMGITGRHGFRGKLHFDILRKTLLFAERIRREKGCSRLLLPGRDVWPLEVMAAKRKIPTTYIPHLSRNVGNDPYALRRIIAQYQIDGSELIVDTGFVGSIVRALGQALSKPMQFCLMSQTPRSTLTGQNPLQPSWMNAVPGVCVWLGSTSRELLPIRSFPEPPSDPTPWPWGEYEVVDGDTSKGQPIRMTKATWGRNAFNANLRPNQVFPNRRKARREALETEYLPKYFRQGTVRDGVPVLYLADPVDIVQTAVITSNIWRGVDQPLPAMT